MVDLESMSDSEYWKYVVSKLKPYQYEPIWRHEDFEALEADAYGEDYESYDNPYGCSWLDL